MFNISDIDGVKVIVSDDRNNVNVDKITKNTVQTWQPDRCTNETKQDTIQGKISENVVEKYFKTSFKDIVFLSYDDIRNDDFKLHAPFDGLIFKKDTFNQVQLDKIKKLINENVRLYNGRKISDNLRKILRDIGIHTLEVKSTKISAKRLFLSDKDRINEIKKDDFFIYPYHLRKSLTVDNFEKYVQFVENKFPEHFQSLSKKEIVSKILNNEYKNSNDIIVRIYTDIENNKFYLMGYMPNIDILKNQNIKRFFKEGKSDSALYFARPISEGKSIDSIITDKTLWKEDAKETTKEIIKPPQYDEEER